MPPNGPAPEKKLWGEGGSPIFDRNRDLSRAIAGFFLVEIGQIGRIHMSARQLLRKKCILQV